MTENTTSIMPMHVKQRLAQATRGEIGEVEEGFQHNIHSILSKFGYEPPEKTYIDWQKIYRNPVAMESAYQAYEISFNNAQADVRQKIIAETGGDISMLPTFHPRPMATAEPFVAAIAQSLGLKQQRDPDYLIEAREYCDTHRPEGLQQPEPEL